MKQQDVFKKIGGIIEELSDQYQYLQTVTNDLNDLELELFVSNAHFLTDHIEILCKLNLQKSQVRRPYAEKLEPAREHKFFEPVVQQLKPATYNNAPAATEEQAAKPIDVKEPIIFIPQELPFVKDDEQTTAQIDLSIDTPKDSYSYIREEPEIIKHEIILDKAISIDDVEPENHVETVKEALAQEIAAEEINEPVETAIELPAAGEEIKFPEEKEEAEPFEDVAEEEAVVIEKPAVVEEEDMQTINQKMSAKQGDRTSKTDLLSIKPISDVKLAITLNDKLLYVKDLFNGYNLAYAEAIEILNRFSTFEEAMRFLKTNYITKNNWESKPATTEKFYALLKRRYA